VNAGQRRTVCAICAVGAARARSVRPLARAGAETPRVAGHETRGPARGGACLADGPGPSDRHARDLKRGRGVPQHFASRETRSNTRSARAPAASSPAPSATMACWDTAASSAPHHGGDAMTDLTTAFRKPWPCHRDGPRRRRVPGRSRRSSPRRGGPGGRRDHRDYLRVLQDRTLAVHSAPRRRPARPCSRCSVCSPSSSGL
jgi:hypothetical protein